MFSGLALAVYNPVKEQLHVHYFLQNWHHVICSGVFNPHLSLIEMPSFSFSITAV